MKGIRQFKAEYILFILCFLFSLISGCQCTSCSCSNGNRNNKEIKTQRIIPFDFILSRINKEIINNPDAGYAAASASSYQVERGGRLFVTGSDVYYVRDGKIAWQSSPAKQYQKLNGRYYVATGDYVFCTIADGTVLWKTGLVNSGSCEIRDGALFILTGNGEKKLNLKSGEGML